MILSGFARANVANVKNIEIIAGWSGYSLVFKHELARDYQPRMVLVNLWWAMQSKGLVRISARFF